MKQIPTARAVLDSFLRGPDARLGMSLAPTERRFTSRELGAERTTEAARSLVEHEAEERAAKTRRLAEARRRKEEAARSG